MRKTKKSSRDTLPAEISLNPSSEEDEVSVSDTSVNTATKEMKSGKMKKRKLENTKAELLTSCLSVLKAPAPASVPEINHFAFHIAAKLDGMSKGQRILAEKRINDVLFQIEYEELMQNSGNIINNAANANPQGHSYMGSLMNNNT